MKFPLGMSIPQLSSTVHRNMMNVCTIHVTLCQYLIPCSALPILHQHSSPLHSAPLCPLDDDPAGNNKLFGNVPTEIENLTGLQILDLSYNNLGGDISTDVGFKLSNLQELYLSGNQIRQDLDPVFCTRPNIYTEFVSDCKLSEVQCTCCTSCCDGGTDTSQCSESS